MKLVEHLTAVLAYARVSLPSPVLNAANGDLMYVNLLVDLENLIFLSAYSVKDILWLTLLAMLGSLVSMSYYLLQAAPLWTPAMWGCVFISIHATRVWGIVKERRPVAFTADEQLLYDTTFSALSPQ